MNLFVRPVDIAHVNKTWAMVSGYLQDSVNKGLSSDYSLEHIQVYVSSGQWMLLVAVDSDNNIHGAMTMSFINYPSHRVAFVTATGGKLIINQDTFNQLQEIAKYHGATKIQAMARKSMAKLLEKCGMEPCNTLMEYKL